MKKWIKNGAQDVNRYSFQAVITVEACFLIPLCLALVLVLMNVSIYLYNKETATCIANTCVLHGVQMEQESQKEVQSEVERELLQLLSARLLLCANMEHEVRVSALSVTVIVSFRQRWIGKDLLAVIHDKDGISYSYSKKELRMDPAKTIWEQRRFMKKRKENKTYETNKSNK